MAVTLARYTRARPGGARNAPFHDALCSHPQCAIITKLWVLAEHEIEMTNYVLLLGAGFSFNWQGLLALEVFDALLSQNEVNRNPDLHALLMRHRQGGNFEEALYELQQHVTQDASLRPQLDILQAAIGEIFLQMNRAFVTRTDFEFSNQVGMLVREMLVKFDAIFTLNQDLLLDRRYMDGNLPLTGARRWGGAVLPGVGPMPHGIADYMHDAWLAARRTLSTDDPPHAVHHRTQPIFKLHGSSNWVGPDGDLLIMGGGKAEIIAAQPLLAWYFEELRARLGENDTKLMVIGYGFHDEHVNAVLADAARNGLRIFLVDPSGVNVLEHAGEHADALRSAVAGISRRPLSQTFAGDQAEHTRLMRFFDP